MHQLSRRLNETNDPETRHELLTEMRLPLGDAGKIAGREMDEDSCAVP